MLKCSTSLWSADLSNLAAEVRRVEPYSEGFHLDVADDHYVHEMLFFPDLVRALPSHTRLLFEIHLMTDDPCAWVEPFAAAGADRFIVCFDSTHDLGAAIEAIRRQGKCAGISLQPTEPPELLEPFWDALDNVTIVGRPMGTKGTSMDPGVPDKISAARRLSAARGARTEIIVDGGMRRATVPPLHAAGADYIVPGSLMFREDPGEMRESLASL
jgi:ribulose-phosphate 3-epimerase